MLLLDPADMFTQLKVLPSSQGIDWIRGILAVFLPFGLNDKVDQVCSDKLGIPTPNHPIAMGKTQYVYPIVIRRLISVHMAPSS